MNALQQANLAPAADLDVNALRAQFPILATQVNGKPLVYLDNAATTQKPRCVIDAVSHYYETTNANVHRGIHTLSERATDAHEHARSVAAKFLNAASMAEIVFTRGATEAINLVAQSYGRSMLKAGDEILITWLEHHANIVPWQMLCQQIGTVLKVVPVLDDGSVDMAAFRAMLGPRTRLVSVAHVSNALGTINPVRDMVTLAHAAGAKILVDGAQAVAHDIVDVQALDCDFYTFSGHKIFAPTGIGVLYGRQSLLEAMPPWQGGGDMIKVVGFDQVQYNDVPWKFEAGTPHIAGAIGLGVALEFVMGLDRRAVAAHEAALLQAGTRALQAIPGLRLIGTAAHKGAVLSFVIDGTHPADVGKLLDSLGIAVRVGHHCAMPILARFGVPGTVRASLAMYNTLDEVRALDAALRRVRGMLI